MGMASLTAARLSPTPSLWHLLSVNLAVFTSIFTGFWTHESRFGIPMIALNGEAMLIHSFQIVLVHFRFYVTDQCL